MFSPRHTIQKSRASSAALGALLLCALGAALLSGGCAGGPWGDESYHRPESDTRVPAGVSDHSAGGAPDMEPEDAAYEERISGTAPLLRVGLERGSREVLISCDGPLSVRLFGESVREWRQEEGGEWRFRAAGDGVEGDGDGGSFPHSRGTVRVSPAGDASLEFEGARYRGEMEVFVASPGSLAIANVVDVESYLRGVVPKEIGPRPVDEIEAVKAQAVAARTYAMASSGKRAEGSFDVLATVEDQVYAGVDVEDALCDRAIFETEGVVAEWLGEPVNAYFHASCGGRTEARDEVWELPGVAYLQSVWDTPGGSTRVGSAFCSQGPNFTWEESWDGSEMLDLVRKYLPATASTPVNGVVTAVRAVRVTDRTTSGRVRWLEVETNLGKHRVFGDRVRWLLRRPDSGRILRSAWFDLDVELGGARVGRVTARGRGYGHGVGMCQNGAMEMAREGYSYEDILKHYYPGIELAEDYGRPTESD